MDRDNLREEIKSAIKQNGIKAITAPITQNVLLNMVDNTLMPEDAKNGVISAVGESIIVGKAVYDYTLRAVNTIAELRTIQGEEGQKINLLGYYEAGDKPVLMYKWVPSDLVGIEDDGGSVIIGVGGYWEALFLDSVNAFDFGLLAYIDSDQSSVIQKTIDFAAEKKLKLFFGKGHYYVNGRNEGNQGIKIRSNSYIHNSLDAVFEVLPTSIGYYQCFVFDTVENCYVNEFNVIGESDKHLAPVGYWKMWKELTEYNVNDYLYINGWGFKVIKEGVTASIKPDLNDSNKVGSTLINGSVQVEITNSYLIPNSQGSGSTLGEWGMGVSILSSRNINIGKITATNFWGDGVYFGKSQNIEPNFGINIKEIYVSKCRRQGVSVEHIDGLNINYINIKEIIGTSPSAGIDFEPARPSEYIKNVNIGKIDCTNTAGFAIILIAHYQDESSEGIYANIGELNDYDCGSVRISSYFYENHRKGVLKIGAINSTNARNNSIQFNGVTNGTDLIVGDINIINNNTENLPSPFGAGIRQFMNSNQTTYKGRSSIVSFNNITCTSTSGNVTKSVDVYEHNSTVTAIPVADFNILNSLTSNGIAQINNEIRLKTKGFLNYEKINAYLSNSGTLSPSKSTNCKITNLGKTNNSLFSVNNLPIGFELQLTSVNSFSIGVSKSFGFSINSINTNGSEDLVSTTPGSSLTIIHRGQNIWEIKDIYGVWNYGGKEIKNIAKESTVNVAGLVKKAKSIDSDKTLDNLILSLKEAGILE